MLSVIAGRSFTSCGSTTDHPGLHGHKRKHDNDNDNDGSEQFKWAACVEAVPGPAVIYQQASGGWVVRPMGAARRYSSRKLAEEALHKHQRLSGLSGAPAEDCGEKEIQPRGGPDYHCLSPIDGGGVDGRSEIADGGTKRAGAAKECVEAVPGPALTSISPLSHFIVQCEGQHLLMTKVVAADDEVVCAGCNRELVRGKRIQV